MQPMLWPWPFAVQITLESLNKAMLSDKSFSEINTSYGFKKEGLSKFVVVAPHGAGDDWKTKRAARLIAQQLNSYLVVNDKFFKPSNKRASQMPEYVEDFNSLHWGTKTHRYLWVKKNPAMKEFYLDIRDFCRQIRKPKIKPVIIYIHGIKSKNIGIDIGVGIKSKNEKKILHKQISNGDNSGLITIRISHLKKIKEMLKKELNPLNLNVTVGDRLIGWSKKSAIQFHKHGKRNDFALQLELNRFLRRRKNIELTSKIISRAMEAAFE
jgi:hypothetical protein